MFPWNRALYPAEILRSFLKEHIGPRIGVVARWPDSSKLSPSRLTIVRIATNWHPFDALMNLNPIPACEQSRRAPIHNLLPEVLEKVFALVFPVISLDDSSESLLYLGQVCRFWRDIIVTSPNLWTSLSFCNEYRLQIARKRLQHALPLSKALPLSLSISLLGDLGRQKQVFYAFVHSLSPHIYRLSCLTLDGNILLTLIARLSRRTVNVTFPELRFLRLTGKPPPHESTPTSTVLDAPLLADLEFGHRHNGAQHDPWGIIFPWQQLIRYNSNNYLPIKMLSRMARIQRLVLSFDSQYDIVEQFIFPDLRHLQLLHVKGVPERHLVDNFTAPNLQSLFVSLSIEHTTSAASIGEQLSRFIRRSSCRITNLSIRGLPRDAVEELLDHTPDVTELKITYAGSQNHEYAPYLSRLTSSPNNTTHLLPSLAALTIVFEKKGWKKQSLVRRFVEIIKSRVSADPGDVETRHLRLVNIYGRLVLEKPAVEILENLKADLDSIGRFYINF